MDEFLQLLAPGAYVGGIDLRDCYHQPLVAPTRRRYFGARHPISGILGVYFFLPFGLGPSPGWNDKCVRAVLELARAQFPQLRMVVFVGDIRFVDASGEHGALAVGMTGFMPL